MTPLRTLRRTDLRRGATQTKNGPIIIVAFIVFVSVIRGEGAPGLALVLAGTSIIWGAGFAGLAVRDRFDGTLEFLAGLPVAGSTVARGRLEAVAILCVLGGLQMAGAAAIVLPPGPTHFVRWRTVVLIGIGSWGAITAVSFALTALLTRYNSTEATTRLSLGFVAFGALAIYGLDLFAPDMATLQARLTAAPWQAVVPGVLLLSGGLSWWGLRVMSRGVDRHVPEPDAMVL